jgi:TolB-like protein/Flp pilus assembly protein TadD
VSEPASAHLPAVFLSYAREDTDAARRIAEALRAFGIEAWFDQSELRGGDTWDQKIRNQIRTCTLFLPIISAQTQARAEGYFRREWKLAVERTHDMAAGVAFIVPVVIDETRESDAAVPEEFMRYQWTRLARGVPTPQFVEQVKRLLEAPRKAAAATRPAFAFAPPPAPAELPRERRVPVAVGVGALAVIAIGVTATFFATRKPQAVPPAAASLSPAAEKSAAPLNDKSIAVLPFESLSAEKDNESFADGVHEDVITNLSKIRDLKVISRPSVLAYRDTASRNLRKIAAELGVANVLVGSVRRAGNSVRVSAQLIDARTDGNRWADSYDGELTNIFALQAKLAQEIASALKATLTPGERTLIERRPTQNQEAYGLYLRGKALEDLLTPRSGLAKFEQAATLYAQAVARDPEFALAYTQLTYLHAIMYWFGGLDPTPARRARAQEALAAAERLSPDSPETHIARGTIAYFCDNDWPRSLMEYRAAEAGLPNNSRLHSLTGFTLRRLGQWTETVRYLQRTLELNPSDFYNGTQLAAFLIDLRRFDAAHDLARGMAALVPGDSFVLNALARAQFARDGDRAAYLRTLATLPPSDDDPTGLRAAYRLAMLSGDLAAAERALTDPRFTTVEGSGGVLVEPAALHRAIVARLRGQTAEAGRFADEAIAWYGQRTFPPRQQPYVRLAIARANAFAGRAAVALPELEAATALALKLDAYAGPGAMVEAGRAYAALERREEALALLRRLMTGPSALAPNEIRIDPLWSRLKDDPRFEEYLKAAKPL